MAFRAEKRTCRFIGGLLLAPALFGQQSFQYEAWHVHSRSVRASHPRARGTLTITDSGVSFQEEYRSGKTPRHPHTWRWVYQDIHELKMYSKSLTVRTYQGTEWKLGADREYEFDLLPGRTFEDSYGFLRTRLDQRFVAAIADSPAAMLWEIPVKRLVRFGGDQGLLKVGADEIVYRSAKKGASRTWRYQDIDNISSSGPFELTITTFERAKLDYGNRKQFTFSLKAPLEEGRYNDLWLRLNQSKGLRILSSYRDTIAGRSSPALPEVAVESDQP